jgi:hypothetical protein
MTSHNYTISNKPYTIRGLAVMFDILATTENKGD